MNDSDSKVEPALEQPVSGVPLFGVKAGRFIRDGLWNADVSRQVAATVQCMNVAGVQRAVRLSADHGAPMAVLSGGHDWAGRAACPDGLTLDLRPLDTVAFDAAAGTVTIGGGACIDDVLNGLPDEMVAAMGTISTVGMVGLTLGGGYGRLNSRFGLALDSLLRAEVVLADGSVAVASEHDDAELFWALRGGGCNFGAVTSITMAVHRQLRVLTGTVFVPLASAKAGLLGMQAILDDNGDDLSIFSALMTVPSAGRGLVLAPLWTGGEAAGERVMRSVAALLDAQVLAQGWSTFKATYSKEFEATWPKGRGYRMDAHNLVRLDEEVVDTLVECARSLPSEADCLMLHDFHGACARVPPGDTAFPLRTEHFNLQVVAGWTVGDDGRQAGCRWIEAVRQALAPLSVRGGYPTILGPGSEARSRARLFYGDACDRLLEAKRRYDPEDLFRSNPGHLQPTLPD